MDDDEKGRVALIGRIDGTVGDMTRSPSELIRTGVVRGCKTCERRRGEWIAAALHGAPVLGGVGDDHAGSAYRSWTPAGLELLRMCRTNGARASSM